MFVSLFFAPWMTILPILLTVGIDKWLLLTRTSLHNKECSFCLLYFSTKSFYVILSKISFAFHFQRFSIAFCLFGDVPYRWIASAKVRGFSDMTKCFWNKFLRNFSKSLRNDWLSRRYSKEKILKIFWGFSGIGSFGR